MVDEREAVDANLAAFVEDPALTGDDARLVIISRLELGLRDRRSRHRGALAPVRVRGPGERAGERGTGDEQRAPP